MKPNAVFSIAVTAVWSSAPEAGMVPAAPRSNQARRVVDTTLCAGPSQPSIGLLYDETPIFLPESHTAFEKLKVPIHGCWMIFAPTEVIPAGRCPTVSFSIDAVIAPHGHPSLNTTALPSGVDVWHPMHDTRPSPAPARAGLRVPFSMSTPVSATWLTRSASIVPPSPTPNPT